MLNKFFHKREGGEWFQDVGIEGHGSHWLPQILQKYFYMWNNSHKTLVGNLTQVELQGKSS